MRLKRVVAVCAVVTSFAGLAETQITVVNFLGANGDAQKIAYFAPFEKATGSKVVGVASRVHQLIA